MNHERATAGHRSRFELRSTGLGETGAFMIHDLTPADQGRMTIVVSFFNVPGDCVT
jgi:hypothetical protein